MKSWFEKLHETFIVGKNYEYIIDGFKNTIIITLCALVIGVIIGSVIAIAKYYAEGNPKLKFVNWICDIYTTVIRGIPMTVLLMIFVYIIFGGANLSMSLYIAILAFGVNSGAYVAEIIRAASWQLTVVRQKRAEALA